MLASHVEGLKLQQLFPQECLCFRTVQLTDVGATAVLGRRGVER